MRPIWAGSLSFGLINIPVKIYSASEETALRFRMLDKHGYCPISFAKVCRTTGKEVKYQDIVRGYEYQPGDYVVLTDEEMKKAAPKRTKLIEVTSFVPEKEIEGKSINRPYYIEPDKKAEKAYVLLREALKKSKKVGIGKFVIRDKEHLVMIKPEDRALMLITLRFQEEMRSPEKLNIPGEAKYTQKELDLALLLINQLQDHFNAADYHDTYTEELMKVIERKAKGQPIRIADESEVAPTTDMRNLMEILRQSLEKEKAKARSRK